MSDDKPVLEETTQLEKTTVPENSRKHFKYRSNTCLNCGHPLDLSDRFCPYCSQLNSTKPLSFKDFFGEFFNSIISYDSRLRYTIRDLLFKPGTITHRYINGQRLRYANPFRFFLSVSIIFFILNQLVSTITGDDNINFNNTETKDDGIVQWSTGSEKDSINFRDELEKVKALQKTVDSNAIKIFNDSIERALEIKKQADNDIWEEMKKGYNKGYNEGKKQFQKDTIPETKVEKALTTKKNVKSDSLLKKSRPKDTTEAKIPAYITQATIDTSGFVKSIAERLNTYWDFYDNTEIKDPIIALDSLGHEKSKTNVWLYEKNFTVERFKEKPSDFVAYALNKVPFFIFFFTPFFALFFWLIYSKKKYTYMEHTVFIFHIFSFVFLAALIALLPDSLLGDQIVLGILLGLIGPFYFYKALRNFYKQSRLITIIKFVFLNIVFLISSTIAASLFFLITAAVY